MDTFFPGRWRRTTGVRKRGSVVSSWDSQFWDRMWEGGNTRSLHQGAGFPTLVGTDNSRQQKAEESSKVTKI